MEVLRAVLLIAATVVMGMGGIFFLYSNTIMPGLGKTDDRTFVGAFQAIDTRIINPVFMPTFFGGLVLSGVSVALHLNAVFWVFLLPFFTSMGYGAGFIAFTAVLAMRFTANLATNNFLKLTPREYQALPFRMP
ncbi:MAG: hypothetical protein PVJ28_02875 [Acidimicrobiia bacterium]